jgi:hypothetical protein
LRAENLPLIAAFEVLYGDDHIAPPAMAGGITLLAADCVAPPLLRADGPPIGRRQQGSRSVSAQVAHDPASGRRQGKLSSLYALSQQQNIYKKVLIPADVRRGRCVVQHIYSHYPERNLKVI